jgi:prepilin-type N-terminal cleavage/methylation domain-containing protein
MNQRFYKPQQKGFSYVEVLVATALIAIALVPAMNALQTGILSADVHQTLTTEYYVRLKKMEELQATPFSNLLAAAKVALNNTTATSYSDAAGTTNRSLVYIALYDADANPFTITDSNKDVDNDVYTGDTANLLWVKVVTEGSAQGLETLISR